MGLRNQGLMRQRPYLGQTALGRFGAIEPTTKPQAVQMIAQRKKGSAEQPAYLEISLRRPGRVCHQLHSTSGVEILEGLSTLLHNLRFSLQSSASGANLMATTGSCDFVTGDYDGGSFEIDDLQTLPPSGHHKRRSGRITRIATTIRSGRLDRLGCSTKLSTTCSQLTSRVVVEDSP